MVLAEGRAATREELRRGPFARLCTGMTGKEGRAFALFGGLALLVWVYGGSLASYLRDQHYQEHFVYLWIFFGLALGRTLRGPFRWRVGLATPRDRVAWGAAAFAGLMVWASAIGGSTTGQRSSLAVLMTALALVMVPRWTGRRCVMHGLLLLLCFGIPYALYFPITSQLQWGVASMIGLAAKLGLADFEMVGHVVVFPHYELAITADCSGIGQLLTFVGIAALGVLSSAPNRRRTVLVLVMAVALAWLSNLARVGLFVALVAVHFTAAIDDVNLHAAIGFVVFLPFVIGLVWLILRTHVRVGGATAVPVAEGRCPAVFLLAPLLIAAIFGGSGPEPLARPAYFDALAAPPGHVLQMHAPSEESEKDVYGTQWLTNVRYVADEGQWFDLFHYATNSRSHLCVHKIANCLNVPGAAISTQPAVEVAGRRWWRLAIDATDAEFSTHVYFAFEVAGQRRDDSWATAWRVFSGRLFGGSWEVRLWRVVMPGPMPEVPDAHALRVLMWLGSLSG